MSTSWDTWSLFSEAKWKLISSEILGLEQDDGSDSSEDSDEEADAAADRRAQETPETPETRGWGLVGPGRTW